MEQSKFEYLQYLYKTLKKHDIEILKHFNDESISDKNYFFYGINNDIISNTLNVLINYLSGNIESAGVDISCRSIIEAFVIMQMDAREEITDLQKKIYRYSYSFVDLDNYRILLTKEQKEDKFLKRVVKDKEIATQAMMEHFKCSKDVLKNFKASSDDPCFYLKKKWNEQFTFAFQLKKHPFRDEKTLNMYAFFSLFIHPRCEMNPSIEESIMSVRNLYIDNVINIVVEYLRECKLFITKEEAAQTTDFDKDFFYNPLLLNNVNNIKCIESLFNQLISEACILKNGDDLFTWHFIEKTKYLIIDLMISESLGYKEHVISTIKPLIEEYSVFFAVNSIEDLNEFNSIKKAFWLSSRLQLDAHFNKLGSTNDVTPEDEINKLYESYYKNKYNLDSIDVFKNNLKNNSYYFLSNEEKSYNKYVKTLIKDLFNNEKESKDLMVLYKISKDMCHASGYNFNATEGVVDVSYHKALFYTWKLVKHFISNVSFTLEEHSESCDVSAVYKIVDILQMLEKQAVENVFNEYSLKVSPDDQK